MEFLDIKNHFESIKDTGKNRFTCLCPAHTDNNNSLEVWLDDNDYIAIKCYAGCNINQVLSSIKLQKKDLVTENAAKRFKEKKQVENSQNNNTKNKTNQKKPTEKPTENERTTNKPQQKLNIVKEYNYVNKDNLLLYQVLRLEPKSFRMRQLGANGKWIYNLNNVQKVLYQLPNVIDAVKNNKTIYIVEGEKDVDNLISLGLVATTNVGGASAKINDSKWLPEYNEYFKGANVVVIPDFDEPGLRHAYNLYSNLYQVANNIKFGILPNVPKDKYDVSDVIKHYNVKTKEELLSNIIFQDIHSFEEYLSGMQLDTIMNHQKTDLEPSSNIEDYDMIAGHPYGFCQKTGYRVYTITDFGHAHRVCHLLVDKVRYNKSNDKWYIWNGSLWVCDSTNSLFTDLIKLSLDSIKFSKAIINSDGFIEKSKKLIYRAYSDTMQRRNFNAIINFLKDFSELAILQSQLDCNVNLFNLKNGTYDLEKIELKPHSQGDLLSKQTNIYYNDKATCFAWLDFLDTIFDNDKELISFVQRAVGLTLSGASYEEVLFFCYGAGKNGKSIFFNVLKLLFGDYYKKANVEMILQQNNGNKIPNDVAALPGARLVVFSEIPADRRFNESLLKDLTGNDDIQARFLHKEFFEFKPTHTLWLYGNHKPIIRGSDYGIWRRMVMIPFTVTISKEKQVPAATLLKQFENELPGILNWAIEGYKQYQEIGLNPPTKVQSATNQYKDESDTVLDFINECCITDIVETIKSKDLYIAYSIFCRENEDYKLKNKSFFNKIEEKGFVKFISSHGKLATFKGIILNDKYRNAVDLQVSGMSKSSLFKTN